MFSKKIPIETKKAFDFVKIDELVQKLVTESGIKNGFVLMRSCHTTAALICFENDAQALTDLEKILRRLLPDGVGWTHTSEGINNARAHQAVALLGQTHWLPIKNGQLELGTWQSIFLVEFFEARTRKVTVVAIGE